MNIFELIDADLLESMISDGYITKKTGNGVNVLNYTNKTQYEGNWNEATLKCRGLITDDDGQVLARPFEKFFNLEQLSAVPSGPYEIFDKLDGSLGIMYVNPYGKLQISTRGNPLSWQSQWASERLLSDANLYEASCELIKKQITPLVEIISPNNRIVVDYGKKEALPLIGLIDIQTGTDINLPTDWPHGTPQNYGQQELNAIIASDRQNAEGYVIKWEDGTRAKVKHETYMRLHKIIFQCSEKTVWEMLKDHRPVAEIIKETPTEIQQWVISAQQRLNQQFTAIEKQALTDLDLLPRDISRAEQAAIVKTTQYPGIVFAMLDNKQYAKAIWDMIRPSGAATIAKDRNHVE